jgi:hypothetical protein
MSAVVWANVLLTLPFLIAFIGLPLWLTFHRPQTAPDHAEARAYLNTRDHLRRRPGSPPRPARQDRRLTAELARR